jgi:hypothetical protein
MNPEYEIVSPPPIPQRCSQLWGGADPNAVIVIYKIPVQYSGGQKDRVRLMGFCPDCLALINDTVAAVK